MARQPKLANGNIPYHRRHTQFMNWSWPGCRNLSDFLFSVNSNPLFAGVQSFSEVFKIHKNMWVWGSTVTAQGLTVNPVHKWTCIFFKITWQGIPQLLYTMLNKKRKKTKLFCSWTCFLLVSFAALNNAYCVLLAWDLLY